MGSRKPAVVLPPSAPTLTPEQFAAWRLYAREARIPGLEMIVIPTAMVLAMNDCLAAITADNDALRGHQ